MSDGNRIATMLAAYLSACAVRAEPFSWERHNCCHFAAGWVREATGRDTMQGFGVTPNLRAARRELERFVGSLQAAVSAALGQAPIEPAMARTGDVLLFTAAALPREAASASNGTGFTLGLCSGRHAVLQLDDGALLFAPVLSARAAWRLPEAAA